MMLCSCAGTCEYGNGAPIIKLSAPILRYRTSDDLKVKLWHLSLPHTGRLARHKNSCLRLQSGCAGCAHDIKADICYGQEWGCTHLPSIAHTIGA